jgi:hypothetical protein
MKKEYTEEDIEHLKHKDFMNKKHDKTCKCGYCEMKRLGIPIYKKKK